MNIRSEDVTGTKGIEVSIGAVSRSSSGSEKDINGPSQITRRLTRLGNVVIYSYDPNLITDETVEDVRSAVEITGKITLLTEGPSDSVDETVFPLLESLCDESSVKERHYEALIYIGSPLHDEDGNFDGELLCALGCLEETGITIWELCTGKEYSRYVLKETFT